MPEQLRTFHVTVTARIALDESCLRTEDEARNRALHHGFGAQAVASLFPTRALAVGTLMSRFYEDITDVEIEADDGTRAYLPWSELPYA